MGNPAGEEQERSGSGKVQRILQECIFVDQVAGMVQGHDDHDQATQKINTIDAVGGSLQRLGWCGPARPQFDKRGEHKWGFSGEKIVVPIKATLFYTQEQG